LGVLIRLRLQTANLIAGPCRYPRNHIGSRLPGEAFGRCVDHHISAEWACNRDLGGVRNLAWLAIAIVPPTATATARISANSFQSQPRTT
jgi:hypothetical protein